MVLVGYSDSEGSDNELAISTPKAPTAQSSSSTFRKAVDPAAPRKIKVQLPGIAKEAEDATEDRPAKRARTGGGLGGFNSFLPAPKRTAEAAKKNGLGSGVSLRTSAAAAFSRELVEAEPYTETDETGQAYDAYIGTTTTSVAQAEPDPEVVKPKPAGNPMKFRPLSVANKKKPKKKNAFTGEGLAGASDGQATETAATRGIAPAPQRAKPKVSLFSVVQEEDAAPVEVSTGSYEPFISDSTATATETPALSSTQQEDPPIDPNSLTSVASDLNLSASERRRLFGRAAKDPSAIKITNFNIDAEYASNEQLRAAGEAVEHRAVKAIAPGKHSLQQLVNAASTQKEALEDAWAAGKRNKTEGGSKYGW